MKSDKMSYIIYVDTESLIKKTGGCGNNPENSSIRKIGEHIPCLYSISTIWAFDHIENKHTLYHRNDCEFVNFKRTRKGKENNVTVNKSKTKMTTRCKSMLHLLKKIFNKLSKGTYYWKVRDHYHYTGKDRGAVHSACNFKLNVPNEILVIFHNGSNYDYKRISKQVWGAIWTSWGKYRKVQNLQKLQKEIKMETKVL